MYSYSVNIVRIISVLLHRNAILGPSYAWLRPTLGLAVEVNSGAERCRHYSSHLWINPLRGRGLIVVTNSIVICLLCIVIIVIGRSK